MKWVQLWRFVRGYGMISVEGCPMRQLLESFRAEAIPVWDVHTNQNGFRFCTALAGIKKMDRWCSLHPKTRMHLDKKGSLQVLQSAKQHCVLVSIVCMLIGLLFASQCFYWSADLSGVPYALQAQVWETLQETGGLLALQDLDLPIETHDRVISHVSRFCTHKNNTCLCRKSEQY